MKKLAILLAAVMILPAISTAADTGDTTDKGVVKIYMIGHGKLIKNEVEISVEEAREVMKKLDRAVHAYQPYKDREDFQLTDKEKEEIGKIFNDAFEEMKKAGLIPDDANAREMGLFPHFGIAVLSPILSCGVGKAWIPLYPGEAFMGFMFRPIFVNYFLRGYTGCMNFHMIPPRIEYWDWVGTQSFMILGFAGMYIDFSQIGFGIPPMQYIMGESLLIAGIDWF